MSPQRKINVKKEWTNDRSNNLDESKIICRWKKLDNEGYCIFAPI